MHAGLELQIFFFELGGGFAIAHRTEIVDPAEGRRICKGAVRRANHAGRTRNKS
jgi:hypothetical protein